MLVCKYCGRNLKMDYTTCPGCGSTKFDKVSDFGEKVIKTPPEGGYIIHTDNYEKMKKQARVFYFVGWAFVIGMIIFDLPFALSGILVGKEDPSFGVIFSTISLATVLPFIAIGIIMIFISKKYINKAKNNIQRVQKLAKEGILVKNMPYELVPTGTYINNRPIYCFEVLYENASGQQIPLKSEGKYNNQLSDKDGTVDLLIDPNDYSNYFIDLEIY